jgi:hypothetical protein
MKRWWPIIAGVAGCAAGFAVGWILASQDVNKAGDFRFGASRFIGMTSAIGAFIGFFTAVRLTRGKHVERDGFTLSYKRIEPTAANYRELKTITIADLVVGLREIGYEPKVEACSVDGERRGALDANTAIAGTNIALSDPGVRGWIRLQLPLPADEQSRALGLVEMWSERGGSTEEFALFTLRILDTFVGNLTAKRESSVLSEDPVSVLTAGLADAPVHRA